MSSPPSVPGSAIGQVAPNSAVPDYLQSMLATQDLAKPEGFAELREYIVPPRIKIIQPQTGGDLGNTFKPGNVVIIPNNVVIGELQPGMETSDTAVCKPFTFFPIFAYSEYCIENPYNVGDLPFIGERTFDRNHPIAIKARQKGKKEVREEEMPGHRGKIRTYSHHLNYVVMVENPDVIEPAIMTFRSAGFQDGKTLANLITSRGNPFYYAMRFEATLKYQPKAEGKTDYYRFKLSNPWAKAPYAESAELFEKNKALHEKLAEAFKEGLIQNDLEMEREAPTQGGFEIDA